MPVGRNPQQLVRSRQVYQNKSPAINRGAFSDKISKPLSSAVGGFLFGLGNWAPNVRRENRRWLGLVPARYDDSEWLGWSRFFTILLHFSLTL